MKAHLVRIGNSRGIRLPKPVIDEVGLTDEVELEIRPDGLVIRPVRETRAGWAEAAAILAATGEAGLIDPPASTRFDEDEWQW
jgi:antitoxin MazE